MEYSEHHSKLLPLLFIKYVLDCYFLSISIPTTPTLGSFLLPYVRLSFITEHKSQSRHLYFTHSPLFQTSGLYVYLVTLTLGPVLLQSRGTRQTDSVLCKIWSGRPSSLRQFHERGTEPVQTRFNPSLGSLPYLLVRPKNPVITLVDELFIALSVTVVRTDGGGDGPRLRWTFGQDLRGLSPTLSRHERGTRPPGLIPSRLTTSVLQNLVSLQQEIPLFVQSSVHGFTQVTVQESPEKTTKTTKNRLKRCRPGDSQKLSVLYTYTYILTYIHTHVNV